MIAECQASIAAGDAYQLCLTTEVRVAVTPDPFEAYLRLRSASPSHHGALFRAGDTALLSASPEVFLTVAPDGTIESQPIKGTRRRGDTEEADLALVAELLGSDKERAENLMIVDLMRNDLSRVSVPGTVSVPERAALVSYANVHHLVSRVRARLQPGATAWDAFLAAFPPGSVTGAPKLAAMSVIARHEPPRGPYCGSLFWAGGAGALEASVLIRTVALIENAAGWRFEARAGGGIVADSDAQAEVAETTAKIGAILRALTEAP